jgi:hypothetical protein
VLYRRGVDAPGGGVTWDGASIDLTAGVATPTNAYVGLTAIAGGAIAVWQGPEGIMMRRIVRSGGGWAIEPAIATGIPSQGREMGPSIVASGDEIALLTPSGLLARTKDGGANWSREQVPVPDGRRIKNIAMAGDDLGNLHVVFTGVVDDAYWELRYVRRAASGEWVDAQNVLGDLGPWQRDSGGRQVLADFPTIAVDRRRGIHVAWHGTADTGKYGVDEAFYRYRPLASGSDWSNGGDWTGWRPVQLLWPISSDAQDSYAPSLSFDPTGDATIAVTFFVNKLGFWETGARVIRNGTASPDLIRLSQASDAIMPTDIWFPSAAPLLHHDAAGRAWLDVVETMKLQPEEASPHVIVHQAVDLTGWLAKDNNLAQRFLEATALPNIGRIGAWSLIMALALLVPIPPWRRRRRRATDGGNAH